MDEDRPSPEEILDYVEATLKELRAETWWHLEKLRTLQGDELKAAVQAAQGHIEMLGMDPEPW